MKVEVKSEFSAANNDRLSPSVPRTTARSTRKHPRRIWESESPPSSPHSPPVDPDSGVLRFINRSDTIVHAFQTLAEEKVVVLLTPIVSHPPDSGDQDYQADPFEVLGRALSRYHSRIRHVPYAPEEPLHESIVTFLRKADAVICVCCEPTTSFQNPMQLAAELATTAGRILNGQMKFARDVRKTLSSSRKQHSLRQENPLLVVTTGPKGYLLDQGMGSGHFDAVAYCPYQSRALGGLADWLYTTSSSSELERKALALSLSD